MTRRSPGDGTFESVEISDLDASELGEVRAAESDLAMVLSGQDVVDLAKTIEPGRSAVVLAGENKWAALRKAGGQLEGHRGERRRRGTVGDGRPRYGEHGKFTAGRPADAL